MSETLTPLKLYNRLFQAYGPQGWWPVTDPGAAGPTHDPARPKHALGPAQQWEVFVGALLTQNTAWRNVEQALARLRQRGLTTLEAVAAAPLGELALALRPSGYYNQKAARLKGLAAFLLGQWGGELPAFLDRPTPSVRKELLALPGIGPETADSILVYGGNGRHALFVVDAYTYRLVERLGWSPDSSAKPVPSQPADGTSRHQSPKRSYHDLQHHFQTGLAGEFAPGAPLAEVCNEYHALIVAHAKAHCRARTSLCGDCPLVSGCRFGC